MERNPELWIMFRYSPNPIYERDYAKYHVAFGTFVGIRLKLQAPAVDGKANAALVAFLAETLRVPKAAVSLKAGRRSRLKQVEVQGLDSAEACRRLLTPAG